MARRKDRTGEITMRLVAACDLPACARQRLGLADDCTDKVEVYRYHRPPYDQHLRDETARRLSEIMQ